MTATELTAAYSTIYQNTSPEAVEAAWEAITASRLKNINI